MAGSRFINPQPQFFDDNGDPLAGGSLTFYTSGTSTLEDTFSDEDLNTANENPVDLDADGRPGVDIFLDVSVTYRAVLKNSAGTTIWDKDPLAGGDIAAAIAAHNADVNSHFAATESSRGFIELASQSEVNAGVDATRAVTPATLAGRTATESRTGIVELATTAEASAGVDTARAVTPAGLAAAISAVVGGSGTAFASAAETLTGTSTSKAITPGGFAGNKSLAETGYYRYPGGLTFQWGKVTPAFDIAGPTYKDISFTTSFSTMCVFVMAVPLAGSGADSEVEACAAVSVVSKTTTGCRVQFDETAAEVQSVNVIYLAVGY